MIWITHIGPAGAQVRYSRVSRAVSVLRVCQRRRERLPDAFRGRALDRSKRERRVRVQSLDLISYGCNYIVILPLNPCMHRGHQSLIPIAFLFPSTLVPLPARCEDQSPQHRRPKAPTGSHLTHDCGSQSSQPCNKHTISCATDSEWTREPNLSIFNSTSTEYTDFREVIQGEGWMSSTFLL